MSRFVRLPAEEAASASRSTLATLAGVGLTTTVLTSLVGMVIAAAIVAQVYGPLTTSANQLGAPCSKYKAFGRAGDVQGFLPTVTQAQNTFLDHQVNVLSVAGGFVAGAAGVNDFHVHYAGFANVSAETPWTEHTVFRLFSQTKFIGMVGFLKFMSEHNVNGDDLLRDFIPAYATPQVIVPYDPQTPLLLTDTITTTAGSNVVVVATPGLVGGIANGANVTISGVLSAVDGIPISEINGVHTVHSSAPGAFSFVTSTRATAGANNTGGTFVVTTPTLVYANILSTAASSPIVTVTTPSAHGFTTGDVVMVGRLDDALPVDGIPSAGGINGPHTITVTGATMFTFNAGVPATTGVALTGGNVQLAWIGQAAFTVYQTQPDFFCTFNFDYYTLRAANPPIAVRHIMEHSLGWTYGTHADLGCTPFNAPGATPFIRQANIQTQIARTLNLAIFGDVPGHVTSGQSVVAWAQSWAAVPLMFDPGAYFSYSPALSLLGAIMEVADASPRWSFESPPLARTADQYMQQRIFDPIGMRDTLFFIQDDHPRRADLLARMSEVYFTHTNVAVVDVIPPLLPVTDFQYGAGRPRGTVMFDTGLLSTAHDQILFFHMVRRGGKLTNGTQLIPATLLAEASRTQNSHFQGGVGGYGNGFLQRGRQATWGYGCAVASLAHPFQTTSTYMGSRAIGWLGVLNTAWAVDFGQNTMMLTGIQGLGGWSELFRATARYNEHLRCIDPLDTDLPSTQE